MQSKEQFEQDVTPINEYAETTEIGKKIEPNATDRYGGADPGVTLPAQWWNFYINQLTVKGRQFRDSLIGILGEFNNLTSLLGIEPDPDKDDQIEQMFKTDYLETYLAQFLATVAEDWEEEAGHETALLVGDIDKSEYDPKNPDPAKIKYKTKRIATLPIELGGTGLTSFLPNRILQTDADGSISYLSFASPNKFLISGNNGTIGLSEMDAGESLLKHRFVFFDFSAMNNNNRKSIKIEGGTSLKLNIKKAGGEIEERIWAITETTSYDFTAEIAAVAQAHNPAWQGNNGHDYFIYLVPDDKNKGVKLLLSGNSTFPNDRGASYTADNTRKIAQFHTLCANTRYATNTPITMTSPVAHASVQLNENVQIKKYQDTDDGFFEFYRKPVTNVESGVYYDVVTTLHPLDGFLAGDILPESVWCLTFHPYSDDWSGMVYDVDTDMAGDIYLQSGTGQNTKSAFGATTTDARPQPNHTDDMRQRKKTLMSTDEFTSFALGSNEKTNIYGGQKVSTTGGHFDSTNQRRMISAIGCEDMCGLLWQWLRDVAGLGTGTAFGGVGNSGFIDLDGQNAFGKMYNAITALLAGGTWNRAARCGSRCRSGDSALSSVDTHYGGRGASRVVRSSL